MVTDELIRFIKEQTLLGTPKEKIVTLLKPGGWVDTDVNEAFQALSAEKFPITMVSLPTGSSKKKIIITLLILLFLAGAGAGGWYIFKYKRPLIDRLIATIIPPKSPAQNVPVQIVEPVPTPVTPPVVTPTPVVFSDADLLTSWTKVPDEQNSAAKLNAAVALISKTDKDFLNKHFSNGYDEKNLPSAAEATAVGSRNAKVLTAVSDALKVPFYQCSLETVANNCNDPLLRDAGRLLLLRSFLLEKAGKPAEAAAIAQSTVDLGRKITPQKNLISLLVGWNLQKYGYERIVGLVAKGAVSVSFLQADKDARINVLREEQRNTMRSLYTGEAEFLMYLADKSKVPSFPQTAEDIELADTYRNEFASTPGSFNLEETKKYFYDTYKKSIVNVDLACGASIEPYIFDFNSEIEKANKEGTQALVENYSGKVLYTVTAATFESWNVKRCEVETLILRL